MKEPAAWLPPNNALQRSSLRAAAERAFANSRPIMKKHAVMMTVCAVVLLVSIFAAGCQVAPGKADAGLAGAWRGKVPGTSGWLASMKGLEFMYVFNANGTMTESSNYDAFPPGPPAYGVWRRVGTRQYEAKYAVF